MNTTLQLRQFRLHTTHVTLSTSVLASTLASGCSLVAREFEPQKGEEDDATSDAVVEQLHVTEAEAASHSYTQVPAGGQPIVMPLELEDSPTTPPPPPVSAIPAARPAAPAVMPQAQASAHKHRTFHHHPAREDDSPLPVIVLGDAPDTAPRASEHGDHAAASRRDPDGCAAAYHESVDAVTRASRHGHRRKAHARRDRDPVGESLLPTAGSYSTLQSAPSYF